MNVIGPAMDEQNRLAARRVGIDIGDVEDASIDLLERSERGIRFRTGAGHFRPGRRHQSKLQRRCSHRTRSQELAAAMIDSALDSSDAHSVAPYVLCRVRLMPVSA